MRKKERGYSYNYNKKKYIYFIIIALVFIFFSKPGDSLAKVKGKCSNCHTMHNTQDGNVDPNGPPNPSLTNNSCVGCHSSHESSTYYDFDRNDPNDSLIPVVYYTGGSAPTDYLAGGNFWWVKEGKGGDDSKGHNVFPGEEDILKIAPGGQGCAGANSCHENFHMEYEEKGRPGLYKRQGCTGCHMVHDINQPNGFHHADDGGPYALINSFPWFRFLQGHDYAGDDGVHGIEDPNWQANADSEVHNEYLGKYEVGGNTSADWSLLNRNTMTAFCSGCHGKFHKQGSEGGPWLRHPSDSKLQTQAGDSEYSYYTVFDPNVPVARPDLSGYSGLINSTERGKVNPGQDLVMCLSCHRAHGSPYPDMLRWDYNNMKVGSSNLGGCFVCHTQKN